MNKSPTKDKGNSLYTPQYQSHPASSQPLAGTALCTSSGLCQRGCQDTPPAVGQVASVFTGVGGRRLAVLRSNHLTRLLLNLFSSDIGCQTDLAPFPIKPFFNFFLKKKNIIPSLL